MAIAVQRLVVKAYPSCDHPTLYPFHLHTICVFIGENDKQLALQRAENELSKRHWRVVYYLEKSTLIEERVQAAGGEVWDAYKMAETGRIFIKSATDQMVSSKGLSMPVLRLGEASIDKVISCAGGHRLSTAEANNSLTLNADYLLGDWIIELKELQEERMQKVSHQDALAGLFRKYGCDDHIELNYEMLDEADRKIFLKCAGAPIRHALQKASKQIAATKKHLNLPNAKGAVIVLNNGYGSLRPDLLPKITKHFASRHSQVDLVISVSQWLITNGFENQVNFWVDPPKSTDSKIESFLKELYNEEEELMTRSIRSRPENIDGIIDPLIPIIFKRDNRWYRFVPETPISSMPDGSANEYEM